MIPSDESKAGLRARMESLGITESDLDEQFIRSGGPGGQHVNKVSTCVRLVHAPTGIEIRCQSDRSRAANRHQARVELCDRLERQARQEREAEGHRSFLRRMRAKALSLIHI